MRGQEDRLAREQNMVQTDAPMVGQRSTNLTGDSCGTLFQNHMALHRVQRGQLFNFHIEISDQ